jgi:hypothetical protein
LQFSKCWATRLVFGRMNPNHTFYSV